MEKVRWCEQVREQEGKLDMFWRLVDTSICIAAVDMTGSEHKGVGAALWSQHACARIEERRLFRRLVRDLGSEAPILGQGWATISSFGIKDLYAKSQDRGENKERLQTGSFR